MLVQQVLLCNGHS